VLAQCSATEKNKNMASNAAVPKTSGANSMIISLGRPTNDSSVRFCAYVWVPASRCAQ
jgi:hypothetical protein